jgi:hypothetical protein
MEAVGSCANFRSSYSVAATRKAKYRSIILRFKIHVTNLESNEYHSRRIKCKQKLPIVMHLE